MRRVHCVFNQCSLLYDTESGVRSANDERYLVNYDADNKENVYQRPTEMQLSSFKLRQRNATSKYITCINTQAALAVDWAKSRTALVVVVLFVLLF